MTTDPWLPEGWQHPTRVDLPTGHHLRPIRADDVDLDMPAVMGSRERLWSIYGEAWGWPPAGMTAEQDREDLAHHEAEMEAARVVQLRAARRRGDRAARLRLHRPAGEAGRRRGDLVVGGRRARRAPTSRRRSTRSCPRWIAADWPLEHPRYVGRDLTWAEWMAIPREGRTA